MRQGYFATSKRGVVIDLKEPICEIPLIPFSDSIFWIHHDALYIAHGTSSLHNRFVYRTLNVAPTNPHAIEADKNSCRYVSTRIKRHFLIFDWENRQDILLHYFVLRTHFGRPCHCLVFGSGDDEWGSYIDQTGVVPMCIFHFFYSIISITLPLTPLLLDLNFRRKLVQYIGCWWPGSLNRQVIINHGIDRCISRVNIENSFNSKDVEKAMPLY